VIVEVDSKRLTPFQLLANRTVGLSRDYFASNGKIKKMNVGLEKSYDSFLTGQKGQRLIRFIAGGVAIPVEGYKVEPENGKDVVTTLDVNIQDITESALNEDDVAKRVAIWNRDRNGNENGKDKSNSKSWKAKRWQLLGR
jgi:cell division protein FtsI (penicillin-binding protein 3)